MSRGRVSYRAYVWLKEKRSRSRQDEVCFVSSAWCFCATCRDWCRRDNPQQYIEMHGSMLLIGRFVALPLLLNFQVATVTALLQPLQWVHGRNSPQGLRSQTHIEVAKWGGTLHPLKQTKLDFLGTLESQYEINKTNRASSIFLKELVGESSPDLLRRLMVETFEDVAPGRWRIVYMQDFSTSFGFGSLLRDVREADVELGNNGEITCELASYSPCLFKAINHYRNPDSPHLFQP